MDFAKNYAKIVQSINYVCEGVFMDKIDKIGIKILYYMKNTKRYKRIEIEKYIERIHQVEKIPVKYLKFLSSFALTRLTQQDLINRIDRGVYQISNKGLKRLEDNKAILQEKINKYSIKADKNAKVALELFYNANKLFIEDNIRNIELGVSEITLQGAFSQAFKECLKEMKIYNYYSDINYNKNKYFTKCIINEQMEYFDIFCDLIIHSRGENLDQDNLLAIEMKKKENKKDRLKDRRRLEIMTSDSYIGEILFDELPPYICRYSLGIFYDLDIKKRQIKLDFYQHGALVKKQTIYYNSSGEILNKI